MSSIVTNELRVGRFTSSQVHCLMKKGKSASAIFSKAGLTYIEKKYHERKLNRSYVLKTMLPGSYKTLSIFLMIVPVQIQF